MDQNTQLKKEFFELCKMLNKSNILVNQKTEVSFFIEAGKNKFVLCGTANKKFKLQLIEKDSELDWEVCGFSNLNLLETELSRFFNNNDINNLDSGALTEKIKSFIFQKLS